VKLKAKFYVILTSTWIEKVDNKLILLQNHCVREW